MATLSSPTLDRLIKEARITLRQPDSSNSTWSDDEITMYLNDAVRQYFLEVVKSAEGQFDTTANLDIVANAETVALPSDFFQLKALFRPDGTKYSILQYRNNVTESYAQQNTGGTIYYPSYYFRGNSLVLRPIPGFSETSGLKLEYTAFPETMIWGGDTLTSRISPVFKELIIFYAVYKCKLADDMVNGSQTSIPAERHLGQLYKKFQEQVTPRSIYPQFVQPFNPE